MTKITKKIINYAIIIIALIFSFSIGVYSGINLSNKLYTSTDVDKLYVRIMSNHSLIKKIDENKISDSHSFLLARLNGDIIALDILLPEIMDNNEKEKIKKLLSAIAIHRNNYPKYYNEIESIPPEIKEVNLKSSKILEKYLHVK